MVLSLGAVGLVQCNKIKINLCALNPSLTLQERGRRCLHSQFLSLRIAHFSLIYQNILLLLLPPLSQPPATVTSGGLFSLPCPPPISLRTQNRTIICRRVSVVKRLSYILGLMEKRLHRIATSRRRRRRRISTLKNLSSRLDRSWRSSLIPCLENWKLVRLFYPDLYLRSRSFLVMRSLDNGWKTALKLGENKFCYGHNLLLDFAVL